MFVPRSDARRSTLRTLISNSVVVVPRLPKVTYLVVILARFFNLHRMPSIHPWIYP